MTRMLPIPIEYANYIHQVQNSVLPVQSPETGSIFYYLERLWKVVLLKLQVACAPEKIAQVFAKEMTDVQQDPTALSIELSWLAETQISLLHLHLEYSQRNLDVVHAAIFHTQLAHKKIELVNLAWAIKAQIPIPPPPLPPLPPRPNEEAIRREVKKMLTPAQRKEIIAVADLEAITIDTLKGCDLKPNLQRKPAPFYNHVLQLATILDQKDVDHVLPLLEQLDIMSLLYLYEATKKATKKNAKLPIYAIQKFAPELNELIVNKYMALQEERKMVFKTYLETHKNGLGKNATRYIHLLSEIERTDHEPECGCGLLDII